MHSNAVFDYQHTNVGDVERTISTVAGGGLALFGLGQRTWAGLGLALLGGVIASRGVTGHCPMYATLGVDHGACGCGSQAVLDASYATKIEKGIVVNAPLEKVYAMWRDFSTFPQFMEHLALVEHLDNVRSHWVLKTPLNKTVEWDAEIINEIPNQLIGWRSLPESQVQHAGSVRFRELPHGRGTEVRVKLEYQAPAGIIGNTLAKLLTHPENQINEDLKHFKQIIETGEVATTVGQPQGVAM